MIRFLLFFLFSASALGQTFNQALTLTNLLTKTPVVGGLYSVRGYRTDGDWGAARNAVHVPGSTAATNFGNTFAFGTGRLIFTDKTNRVQNLRWWGGDAANVQDTAAAFTNAVDYVNQSMGGGTVYVPAGTYKFLSDGIDVPSGVNLQGDGPLSVFNASATGSTNYPPFLRWNGSRSSSVYIVSNSVAGGYLLTLSGDLNLNQGDTIAIYNTNDFSGGARSYYRAGQFATVSSVTAATNITLLTPLYDAYAAGVRAYKITQTEATVKDMHFALPLQSAGVTFHYGGKNVRLENVSAAGTDYQHFGFHSCFGSQAVGVNVDSDSESVGLNYGFLLGSSQDCVFDRCDLSAGLAGFDAGNSDTDLDFFCWFPRISNSSFKSIRGLAPGLGMHGNVRGAIVDNCQINGINIVGGNTVRNSTIWNGPNYPALYASEMYNGEATVEDNQFYVRTFGLGQSVPLARITLQSSNPGAGGTVDTNIWAGTWTGTTNQWIRFNRNKVKFLSTISAGYYGLYVDENSILAANPNAGQKTFGGIEVIGNKFQLPEDQPYSSLNFDLIYISPKTNVIWNDIIVRDNDLPYGGIAIEANGGRITIENNRITKNTQPVASVRVIRSSYGQFKPTITTIRNNLIDDALYGGILHYRPFGSAIIERNTITDHGRAGSSYAIDLSADAPYTTNLVSLLFRDNLTTVNTGSTLGYNIAAPSAEVKYERNREVGVAAGGSRSWASAVVVPWSTNSSGATNVPATIGSLPTASLPSPAGPAITYDSTLGVPVFWDNSTWRSLLAANGTNFANIYVTNTASVKDILAETITLQLGGGAILAASPTEPFFINGQSNAVVRTHVYNLHYGTDAAASAYYSAFGVTGSLGAVSTNNTSGNLLARMRLRAETGNGFNFDLAFPTSQDFTFTYGGGTEFARLSTNELYLATPTIRARAPVTASPTHFLVYANDPDTSPRTQQSFAISSLQLPASAITNLPAGVISMPSTNGIAVATSSNNIASRHIVGSAQIAVADADGQSGNPTLSLIDGSITTNKVDATFHALLGGSSGSSTNLDNLTVTNATTLLSELRIATSSNNIVKLSRLGMGAGQSNWVIATGSATNLFIAPASDDWNSWVGMELRRKAGTHHELERVVIPGPLNVLDEAYGAGWDGITEVPTKNALYDKIESLGAAGQPPSANLTNFSLATHPAANGKVLYSTNTPSGGFFWGDAPTGGSGATGFTLTDSVAPTTIHAVTNLTVSVNAGDPIQATLSGTAANANLDFQFTKSPLLVNGSPALWSAPWNLNSTTPTIADYGYTNATIQVNGTNATVVIPMRITMIVTNASDGVFTNPPWGRSIRGYLWGPGGGGGSGRRGLTNTVRCSGGGGGSGGYTEFVIPFLVGGETYAWTNRPGGLGGASQTSASTSGNAGGGGLTNDVRFGPFRATGGVGGSGGTAAGGGGGGVGLGSVNGNSGGGGNASGQVGNAGNGTSATASGLQLSSGAGGASGGIDVGNASYAGASGGAGSRAVASTAGGTAGTAGNPGNPGGSSLGSGIIVSGGGGGGTTPLHYSTAGTAGSGGNGGFPGGGGAGGPAGADSVGVTGNNSGAGGNGGDGAIIIIVE